MYNICVATRDAICCLANALGTVMCWQLIATMCCRRAGADLRYNPDMVA